MEENFEDMDGEMLAAKAATETSMYFSPEQWEQFSPIERQRRVSQLRNHFVMQKIGMTNTPPEFVLQFRKLEARKKAAELKKLTRDQNQERPIKPPVIKDVKILKNKDGYYYGKVPRQTPDWPGVDYVLKERDPEPQKQRGNVLKRSYTPALQSGGQASCSRVLTVKQTDRSYVQASSSRALPAKQMDKPEQGDQEDQPRYPRRNIKRPYYKEDPVPEEEDFSYCCVCEGSVLGACEDHGRPFRLFSTPVKSSVCKDRAARTLPKGLRIGKSSIPNAGMGVFAVLPIPPHTMLGPYDGQLLTKSNNDGYCWMIRRGSAGNLSVDAKDETRASWLRYVNCATHDSMQNLVPVQEKGQIFYLTRQWIAPGDELLTWYGKSFMLDLGIDLQAYFEPKTDESKTERALSPVIWKKVGKALQCVWCSISFSSVNFVQRHVHTKHGSEHSLLVLQHKATIVFPPSRSSTAIGACFVQNEVTSSLMMKLQQRAGGEVTEGDKVLARRVRDDGKDRPFVCSVCGNKYTEQGSLTAHKRVHDEARALKCSHCPYVTGIKQNFDHHMLTHTGQRDHVCQVCNKSFTHKGTLVMHVKEVHDKVRDQQCPYCEKTFSKKSNLVTHVRTHTGEKPYQCSQCEYKCSDNSTFNRHMRTHSGEKPYQCSQCEYKCAQSGVLTSHMRTHSGEKPYQCSQCEYKCAVSGDLTSHMRTHSGEKPYQCSQCEYKCSVSGHLSRHMRTHSGDKPYQCSQCEYKCSESGHLTSHMRTHSGEKPYQCTMCDYKAARSNNLKSHVNKHH